MSLTQTTHSLIRDHFKQNNGALNLAIDATCGNGFDSEFLASVGFTHVLAFDLQEAAIIATGQRLRQANITNVNIIQDSHQNLDKHINQPIDCVMFNLGYLPSGDKQITTLSDTSLTAIQKSLDNLSQMGMVTILCYPGHPAGAQETKDIQDYLETQKDNWQIKTHLSSSPKPAAPILFTVQFLSK